MNDRLGVDPELAELFPGEPDLLDLAARVRASRPEAPLAPNYPAYLRARLMDAAPGVLRPRGLRRLIGRRGGWLAGAGALAGAAMVTAVVVTLVAGPRPGGRVELAVDTAALPHGVVDPGGDITIAFNQPMDHTSVERAIHIQPATAYTTQWSGNTLTIVPEHHLAATAAYTVRLDNHTAQASDGQHLAQPVVVSFVTRPAPTPPARPAPTPPPLAVVTLGPAAHGSLAPSGDGGVLLTNGTAPTPPAPAPAPTTATPAASPSASPSAAATPSPSPSPLPSPSPTTAATGSLLRWSADGRQASVLGPAVAAAAVSSAGRSVAVLRDHGDGTLDVVVEHLDGSQARVLAGRADPGSPLAWDARGRVLFVGGGQLRSVDLGGVVRQLPLAIPSGTRLVLAPDGRHAYLAPVTQATPGPPTPSPSPSPSPTPAPSPSASPAGLGAGMIVDLGDGSSLVLSGSPSTVAFAGDGAAVAWVDRSAATPVIRVLAIPASLTGATASPVTVPLGSVATAVDSAFALRSGGTLAISVSSTGSVELRVLGADGTVLGTAPGLHAPVWVSDTTVAAIDAQGDAVLARVVGGPPSGPARPDLSGAGAILDQLVSAQGGADPAGLRAVPVTGSPAPDLVALTPGPVTQAYVVSVVGSADASTISAQVRLVHVPATTDQDQAVTTADEQVTLSRTGGGYAVSGLTVGAFAAQSPGPHVLHVSVVGSGRDRIVELAFDSDLDPGTVAAGVSVRGPADPVHTVVTYDAATRTVRVTVAAEAFHPGPLTLRVDTGLQDVDGNPVAAPYTTTLPG